MNRLWDAGRRGWTTDLAQTGGEPIAVTGMGVLCAGADGPGALWEAVAGGLSPATWFRDPSAPDGPLIPACRVDGSPPVDRLLHQAERMDRSVQLALAAAHQALNDAGLDRDRPDPSRFGVIAGTSRGPMRKWTELVERARDAPERRIPPSLGANTTLASLSGSLSMAFGAGGPCFTVSSACASSAHAIVLGAQQIQLGMADIMLVGGSDAPLHDPMIRQMLGLGLLGSAEDPRRACRPFDLTRDGTLLGEGAAFLVLEPLGRAIRRGAHCHANLVGWGIGSDHAHRAAPSEDGEGLVAVMTQALETAGLGPDDVDALGLHGTGTRLNDRAEARAIRRLFGDRAGSLPAAATKPITGHCLGASAALEAVIGIMAIRHQAVPGTACCAELDPECPIDLVRGPTRPAPLQRWMTGSIGFWGNNASLIFWGQGKR